MEHKLSTVVRTEEHEQKNAKNIPENLYPESLGPEKADIWQTILEFLPIHDIVKNTRYINKFFYREIYKKRLLFCKSFKQQLAVLKERTFSYAQYFGIYTTRAYEESNGRRAPYRVSRINGVLISSTLKYTLSIDAMKSLDEQAIKKARMQKFVKCFGHCIRPRSFLAFNVNTKELSRGTVSWVEPFNDTLIERYPFLSQVDRYINPEGIIDAFRRFVALCNANGGSLPISEWRVYYISQVSYELEFKQEIDNYGEQDYELKQLLVASLRDAHDFVKVIMSNMFHYKFVYDFCRSRAARFLKLCIPEEVYIKEIEPIITNYRFIPTS